MRIIISFIILFMFSITSSCQNLPKYAGDIDNNLISKFKSDTLFNWFAKDINTDSLPGTSLIKASNTFLKYKKSNETIIAIIDTDVDIHHDYLKENVWFNKKEKINGKDDDHNGYIDDINGWNFISDSEGNTELFVNYEYTRIIKKYDSLFKNSEKNNISKELLNKYNDYIRAIEVYKSRMKYALSEKTYIDYFLKATKECDSALSSYFPDKKYTKNKLDSLIYIHKENSKLIKHLNYALNTLIAYDIDDNWLEDYRIRTYERLDKLLNIKFNDRINIGDNSDDINDKNYGSNIVYKNAEFLEHGTEVAGAIKSLLIETKNKDLINNIKFMFLCVSSLGDEHDKDTSLAIRYAINNGAKVINISSGKDFSLYNEWVLNEFKHAQDNNVLIITSAGNKNINLDHIKNYPNDTNNDGNEIVNNFIKVSSSSYRIGKKIKETKTAYSKNEVDIFAPGENIFTASAKKNEKYKYSYGTSIAACITSGIAAILYSYYPSLSSQQVKKIIMDSGMSYDLDVEIEKEDGSKKLVPFSSLSKSGKVVNAYNALLMAEELSKKK